MTRNPIRNYILIVILITIVFSKLCNLSLHLTKTRFVENNSYNFGVIFIVGSIILFLQLDKFAPRSQKINQAELKHHNEIRKLPYLFIIVVGPILEEVLFRHLLLQILHVQLNLPLSIVLSSLVFSIVHRDNYLLQHFGYGLIFSACYIKGGLVLAILSHVFVNFSIILNNQLRNRTRHSTRKLCQ